jgi:hypothetical protein
MGVPLSTIEYLNGINCKLYVNNIEAYPDMVIPSAPTFRINILDGSLFPKDTSQLVTTNTITNYDMRAGVQPTRQVLQQTFSSSPNTVSFSLTTIPYYEFKQSDIDSLNLQHVKAYIDNVLVILGSKLKSGQTLKFVCDNGYKFDVENTLGQNPQPRYSQQRMTGTTNTGGQISNINESGTEASITVVNNNTFYIYNRFTYLTISAPTTPVVLEWGIDQAYIASIANVDVFINGVKTPSNYPNDLKVKIYGGDTIKITPKQYYILLDNQGNYFRDENGNYDYFSITSNEGLLVTGDILYSEIAFSTKNIVNRITVDSAMLETMQTNHVSMFINDSPVSIGSTAINGDVIRIKADSGYELADRPKFTIYSDESGHGGTEYLSLIDENINAQVIIDLSYDYYLTNLEVITTQVDIVTGANNLYKITKADLKQINIDRFVNSGGNPPTVIDYGTNILGVINLPFNINPDYIQDPELIKLGSHETTVTAPKVVTDKLYLDLGDISVPLPENSLGFVNATALIHLPYANSLTLDINAVMGQIINVEYVIDLYNGNSYVNIKSNKSDSIIASSSVDLGINIPYSSMLGDNNTVYNSNMSLGGDNHVKTPYIEIIQNIPILGNGFFTAPITAESKLNNELGFIQVENISLNVTATSNEKDMILTALRSGVIIND